MRNSRGCFKRKNGYRREAVNFWAKVAYPGGGQIVVAAGKCRRQIKSLLPASQWEKQDIPELGRVEILSIGETQCPSENVFQGSENYEIEIQSDYPRDKNVVVEILTYVLCGNKNTAKRIAASVDDINMSCIGKKNSPVEDVSVETIPTIDLLHLELLHATTLKRKKPGTGGRNPLRIVHRWSRTFITSNGVIHLYTTFSSIEQEKFQSLHSGSWLVRGPSYFSQNSEEVYDASAVIYAYLESLCTHLRRWRIEFDRWYSKIFLLADADSNEVIPGHIREVWQEKAVLEEALKCTTRAINSLESGMKDSFESSTELTSYVNEQLQTIKNIVDEYSNLLVEASESLDSMSEAVRTQESKESAGTAATIAFSNLCMTILLAIVTLMKQKPDMQADTTTAVVTAVILLVITTGLVIGVLDSFRRIVIPFFRVICRD